jgi:hypothetical protein
MLTRRKSVALCTALVVGALTASADSALASKWSPNAVAVAAISSRFEFEVETTVGVVQTATCSAFVITGTTGTPNAIEWTAVPRPSRCTVTSSVVGTFKAVALFAGGNRTAQFVINAGGSLRFEIVPGCLISIAPQTISQTGNYSPGSNGLSDAALWRFDSQTVNITYPPLCISSGATTGRIKVAFAMVNRANAANPIEIEA